MDKIGAFLKDKKISDFSKSRYEIALALFSLMSVFFLKDEKNLIYPDILLSLVLFLSFNLAYNFFLRNKRDVNLWVYSFSNLFNVFSILLIINYSGGKDSYMWYLLLLPVMSAAISANMFHSYLTAFVSVAGLLFFYSFDFFGDFSQYFSFIFKSVLLCVSSVFVRNVSKERKMLETELSFKRAQSDMLLKSVFSKDESQEKSISINKSDFSAVAVHDLKNFISVIYLMAQILNRNETPEKKDFSKLLSVSKTAANLSKYCLANMRKKDFSLERLNLKEFIGEIVSVMEYKSAPQNIRLELNIPQDHFCFLDRLEMNRAITNIVLNSILSLKEGSLIKIDSEDKGDFLVLTVQDNGPGFPPEILQGIKPYNTARSKEGGTGLGLYSVMESVKKNSGEMRIFNVDGGGAAVEMVFKKA